MIHECVHRTIKTELPFLALVSFLIFHPSLSRGFEGRINATITQDSQSGALLYTVGTNFLRVEMTATNRPYPVDILDRQTGSLTLLFPHNRSFVRLKPVTGNLSAPSPPGSLAEPDRHPSQSLCPAFLLYPWRPVEKLELKATGEKTNLLGLACEKFEIKQRGETMEIWATDQLLPFQNYVRRQTPHFGPRGIEEQWGELLAAKKIFPFRASLRFDNGTEYYRFEVKSVTPQKLKDEDMKLFQPPDGYFQIEPLPF